MYFQILGAVTRIISVAYELYSCNSHKKLVVNKDRLGALL
jgi:hypothetical protein